MIGKCEKCGEIKEVRNHHYKGYSTDETALYCRSCDYKAHIKARKEGRCKLSPKEAKRSSINSCMRRIQKIINLGFDTLLPNVVLNEMIHYNINTGIPRCDTHFVANNGLKLLYIGEKQK